MKFDEFFELQFGEEPHILYSLSYLWNKADSSRRTLNIIDLQIKEKERWFEQRKAALYAWNLKDKDKK